VENKCVVIKIHPKITGRKGVGERKRYYSSCPTPLSKASLWPDIYVARLTFSVKHVLLVKISRWCWDLLDLIFIEREPHSQPENRRKRNWRREWKER
jgi:hypothetical protein